MCEIVAPSEDNSVAKNICKEQDTLRVVYSQYKRRWWMLSVLCLLNLSNAILWFSFAPVATVSESYYGISRQQVNWLSQVFMLLYIPTAFAATWALDAHNLYFGCRIGAILNVTGSLVRVIALAFHPTDSASYIFIMLGQILGGFGQPFILSATTKLAASWFSDTQRATANTIGSIANPLGIAIASAVTPIIVSEENPASLDDMLWIYAVVCVVLSIPVLTLQSHPPTPPSASASTYRETNKAFIEGIKVIVTSYSYIVLVFVFGIGLGMFNSLTTLLEQILNPNGYTTDDAGLAGALIIVGGLFGAGLAGPILDRTKRYKEMLRICIFGAVLGFVWFAIAANTAGQLVQILICSAIMGFFAFAILPTSLELGAECTYPVNEGTSTGFLYMSGQLFGIIFISIMDGPLTTGEDRDMTGACWFLVGMGGLAFIGAVVWRGEYLRSDSELALLDTEQNTVDACQEEHVPSPPG
eukprot:CFRG4717T1